MTEKELKATAENLSDSLFFAEEELRNQIIDRIEKVNKELAQQIKENIIFR